MQPHSVAGGKFTGIFERPEEAPCMKLATSVLLNSSYITL
jgi:hypothetical protein